MAKRKRVRTIVKRVVKPALEARRRVRSSHASVKNTVAAVVGGAAGSVVGGLLVRVGMSPQAAAIGVTAVGSVGAIALSGPARSAMIGVAAAGAGQVVLVWMASRQPAATPEAPKRQGYDKVVNRAFHAARRQMADSEPPLHVVEEVVS